MKKTSYIPFVIFFALSLSAALPPPVQYTPFTTNKVVGGALNARDISITNLNAVVGTSFAGDGSALTALQGPNVVGLLTNSIQTAPASGGGADASDISLIGGGASGGAATANIIIQSGAGAGGGGTISATIGSTGNGIVIDNQVGITAVGLPLIGNGFGLTNLSSTNISFTKNFTNPADGLVFVADGSGGIRPTNAGTGGTGTTPAEVAAQISTNGNTVRAALTNRLNQYSGTALDLTNRGFLRIADATNKTRISLEYVDGPANNYSEIYTYGDTTDVDVGNNDGGIGGRDTSLDFLGDNRTMFWRARLAALPSGDQLTGGGGLGDLFIASSLLAQTYGGAGTFFIPFHADDYGQIGVGNNSQPHPLRANAWLTIWGQGWSNTNGSQVGDPGSAAFKLVQGPILAIPEKWAIENRGDYLFWTDTNNTRFPFLLGGKHGNGSSLTNLHSTNMWFRSGFTNPANGLMWVSDGSGGIRPTNAPTGGGGSDEVIIGLTNIIDTSAIVAGQIYTNNTGSNLLVVVSVSISVSNELADITRAALFIDNDQDGAFETTMLNGLSNEDSGVTNFTVETTLVGGVLPGGAYTVTNLEPSNFFLVVSAARCQRIYSPASITVSGTIEGQANTLTSNAVHQVTNDLPVLVAGSNITLTPGSGIVTISSTIPSGLVTNQAPADLIVTNAGVKTTITSNSVTSDSFTSTGSGFSGDGDGLTNLNSVGFNVRNAGAVGDGVTDDTLAFRNALTNLSVFVPPGSYLVTNLTVSNHISGIRGQSILLFGTNATGYCLTLVNAGTIASLVLDGQATNNYNSVLSSENRNGIDLYGTGSSLVQDVVFKNFAGRGISVRGLNDIAVRLNHSSVWGCYFTNNLAGIWCDTNNTSEYTTIAGNYVVKNLVGLRLGSANIEVTANNIHDCSTNVWLGGSGGADYRSHCNIVGNTFNHGAFVIINAGSGSLISGNNILGGTSIYIRGVSTNNIIQGNYIQSDLADSASGVNYLQNNMYSALPAFSGLNNTIMEHNRLATGAVILPFDNFRGMTITASNFIGRGSSLTNIQSTNVVFTKGFTNPAAGLFWASDGSGGVYPTNPPSGGETVSSTTVTDTNFVLNQAYTNGSQAALITALAALNGATVS